MAINKTHKVVKALGGYKAAGYLIGVTRNAVHQWVEKDYIPCESGIKLLLRANKIGIPLTLAEVAHHIADPEIAKGVRESQIFKKLGIEDFEPEEKG